MVLWRAAGADQQPGGTRAARVGVDAADAEFGLGAGGGLGRDMSRPRERRCLGPVRFSSFTMLQRWVF